MKARLISPHQLILKRGSSGVCALWSVTETNQNRREVSMRLLEDDDLATGEELPINAPQLINPPNANPESIPTQHVSSPLGRHHHVIIQPACS